MSWWAILEKIVKMLGPLLEQLLNELFANAQKRLTAAPGQSPAKSEIATLFTALRAETWVWQFGKRARLKVAERIATNHASEIYAAVRNGTPAPILTSAEAAEIREL